MEMNQYLSMFIDESKDHLQAMNEHLLGLESSPEDIAIVQNIFRSAHTLKGMSATMGFEDLASLTHEMENVLDLVRNHKLAMDSFIFDCLFKSLDALESMVEDIIQGGTGQADVTEIVAALKSVVSGDYAKGGQAAAGSKASAAGSVSSNGAELDEFQFSILKQTIEAGMMALRIGVTVREDCVLKAARAYMVFNVLEQNGEVIKSNPAVEDIEQEKFDRSFTVYYVSNTDKAELEKQLSSVSEIDQVEIIVLDEAKLGELTKPVVAEAKPSGASAPQPGNPDGGKAPETKKPAASGGAPVSNRTIRVDIERLDALMNLFSELLIDRVRLEQLSSEIRRNELTETVEHMARVSSDLQNIVLKLRMVPIDTVFNRFPRMIRDVAKSLDKKVDLIITGADTELDRTVIDEIGDPLVHLLRNAVDHGVERAAERLSAGKPETGTIYLRAFHSGNHVFIEIEEDGRGVNHEKVLNKAIQNGVLTKEQASRMTEAEITQLIFASGFSTADKISDISGRGVGLDVVKTKIESLGGHVEVTSKWGKGSKFSVQLPLTLSIISAMLIRLAGEKYAIPLTSIVETMAIRKDQLRTVHGSVMIEYRNSVVPLIPLAKLFDVPGSGEGAQDEDIQIVIIRKGDKVAALKVDEFIGQQEIVLKSLGKYLTGLFAISGGTILGDGQVALIIDTNALIK